MHRVPYNISQRNIKWISVEQGPRPLSAHRGLQISNIGKNVSYTQISKLLFPTPISLACQL